MSMPATPLKLSDVSLPRRSLDVGDLVTDEDPTSTGYRITGRIVSFIPKGEEFPSDPLLAMVDFGGRSHTRRTRSEIRSIFDKPMSAQIGFGAVWEREFITLTRRTNDPKLAWIEKRLQSLGIDSIREGESFHAPILKVPKEHHDVAWAVVDPIDDVPDDDPRWG